MRRSRAGDDSGDIVVLPRILPDGQITEPFVMSVKDHREWVRHSRESNVASLSSLSGAGGAAGTKALSWTGSSLDEYLARARAIDEDERKAFLARARAIEEDYHKAKRRAHLRRIKDWEQDFAYYYVLADLDPVLAEGWSKPSLRQPFTNAHGHLTTADGHLFNAEAEFDGSFWASSASTSVARVRVLQRDPSTFDGVFTFDTGSGVDTMVDVKEFNDGSQYDGSQYDGDTFDPAFPCWDIDHLNVGDDNLGGQVARMAAGRDGYYYKEITAHAAKPCYMAAHVAEPWTRERCEATRKPVPGNPDDQAYLRAARKHNRTRKKGEPRVREDRVPAYYTPAPSDFNAGEALYEENDDDARDLRRALSSLYSVYHAPAFNCLLASGSSYDAREFALLLVATRWRLFMEKKAPRHFPMFAEHILDRARASANMTIRHIRGMVERLRAKNNPSSLLRPNDPRRGPRTAAEKDAEASAAAEEKPKRRRRGGRRRKTKAAVEQKTEQKKTEKTEKKKRRRRRRRGGRS